MVAVIGTSGFVRMNIVIVVSVEIAAENSYIVCPVALRAGRFRPRKATINRYPILELEEDFSVIATGWLLCCFIVDIRMLASQLQHNKLFSRLK